MTEQPHRLHYLDHARGFIILLVVLQHSVQAFGEYWGKLWFVHLNERSETYDYLFMWTDSFIMQALFLISGMFVLPSLQKRGWLSFTREKLTRLGLVFIFGTLLLVPLETYPKFHMRHNIDYLEHWYNVFTFESFQLSGFWFISLLLVLTFFTALIWTILPSIINVLGRAVKWMCDRPVIGFLIFGGITALLITVSDLYWGTPWWISPIPHFIIGRANMFFSFLFYFFIGVGVRQSGILDDGKFMKSVKESWPKWAMLMIVVSLIYVGYSVGYMYEGALDTSNELTRLFADGNFPRAFEYISDNGMPIIIRTVLHGFSCAAQSIAIIVLLLAFTNKKMHFWTSLGACSYGIFVFHEPIVVWMHYLLIDSGLPLFVFAALTFAVGLTLSWQFTDKVMRRLPFTNKIF